MNAGRFALPEFSELISIDEEEALCEDREFREFLGMAKKKLNPRSYYCLIYFFGINGNKKTLEEIGCHFKITRERVRQLISAAISKISGDSIAAYRRRWQSDNRQKSKRRWDGEAAKILLEELMK